MPELSATVQKNPVMPSYRKGASAGFDWLCILVPLAFVIPLVIWFGFDHSWPSWDAAQHIKDSFSYARLFAHARPLSLHWYYKILTVNFAYPAVPHEFNGLMKAVLGSARWVDGFTLVLYAFIMNFAVWKASMRIFNDKLTALLAVFAINSFPLTAALTHVSMLDLPMLAFHCLAIWALCQWLYQKTWLNAFWLGIALSFASGTKQVAPFFLVGPCALLFLIMASRRCFSALGQLLLAGLFTVAGFALWILPNYQAITHYIHATTQSSGAACPSFMFNLKAYSAALPFMMSPLLFVVMVAGLFLYRPPLLSALGLSLFGALSGLVLLCALSFCNPEPRYFAPALLSLSFLTANALAGFLSAKNKFLKAAGVLVIVLSSLQFVVLNFAPYPLPLPQAITRLSAVFSGRTILDVSPFMSMNPNPPGDPFGKEWIIDTIGRTDGRRICRLNVMPNTLMCNVHTLELIAIYKNLPVQISTFRLWTLGGDKVSFSEDAVRSIEWYVLKTGEQGTKLADGTSAKNYEQIERYIKESGRFELKAQRNLADGSTLYLYRLL